jgi:predicted nucleic acid-binding protein
MPQLLDSSLWVTLLRRSTSPQDKEMIGAFVRSDSARVADPIKFELLRFASSSESDRLAKHFALVPTLATPDDLWMSAAELGQLCRKSGKSIGALDLLIAAVALSHDAVVVTFDSDFAEIAQVSLLRTKILRRTDG